MSNRKLIWSVIAALAAVLLVPAPAFASGGDQPAPTDSSTDFRATHAEADGRFVSVSTSQPGATSGAPAPTGQPTPKPTQPGITPTTPNEPGVVPDKNPCQEFFSDSLEDASVSIQDCFKTESDLLAGPTFEEAQAAAVQVMAQLTLPTGKFELQPKAEDNDFGILPVNWPLWFYLDPAVSPWEVSTSSVDAASGLTVSIAATRLGIRVWPDEADRKTKQTQFVDCTKTAPRPAKFNKPEDTLRTDYPGYCGYTYQKKGNHNLWVRSFWQINWSAGGYSGSFDHSFDEDWGIQYIGEIETILLPEPKDYGYTPPSEPTFEIPWLCRNLFINC